jgi:hypothetical protein
MQYSVAEAIGKAVGYQHINEQEVTGLPREASPSPLIPRCPSLRERMLEQGIGLLGCSEVQEAVGKEVRGRE